MVVSSPRALFLEDRSLVGSEWSRAYTDAVDDWMRGLYANAVADHDGVAVVAVGGYGRSELAPYSDLDVVLVHARGRDVEEVAEQLWYPIWDAGLKLGHAVRTIRQTITLAEDDLDTATSLLSARHIAGDRRVTQQLTEAALEQWRRDVNRWMAELDRAFRERHDQVGEVAFLLEPDLKNGKGGMRDLHGMLWLEVGGRPHRPPDRANLLAAYDTLMSARVELHRSTGRYGNRLLLEEQDAVAAALGDEDADVLMGRVSAAGRHIAWVAAELRSHLFRRSARRRWLRSAAPKAVTAGVVTDRGAVALAPEADLTDSLLPLRVAAAAAQRGEPIDRRSLELLMACPPLPEPWPEQARRLFVRLLLAGHDAIPTIEALDQTGQFVRLLPEWEPTRSKPQRNAYHRYTVDRHLLETAAEAAELTDRVDRDDLLVIGALLHDIGKGYPGDHTIVGMELVPKIAQRMGFAPLDIDVLVAMVEHHLLLPDVATRRDLEDEETVRAVAEAVRSVEVLRLLGALTEADSIATGPSAWSNWKAGLVLQLVTRTLHFLGDGPGEVVRVFPTVEHKAHIEAGEMVVAGSNDVLTVVTPDRPSIFYRIAGVLTLHRMTVLQANSHTESGWGVLEFRVEADGDEPIDWHTVSIDVERAIAGKLALQARVNDRVAAYESLRRPTGAQPVVEPKVSIDNELSSSATVIEVAAPDSVGLLFRVTQALTQLDLDILTSKVQTLGDHVVDSFYVRDSTNEKVVDPHHLAEIERAIFAAIPPPAVAR